MCSTRIVDCILDLEPAVGTIRAMQNSQCLQLEKHSFAPEWNKSFTVTMSR